MKCSPDCSLPSRRGVLQLLMVGGAACAATLTGCDMWYEDVNPNQDGSEEDRTAYQIQGLTQHDVLAEAYPEGRPEGDLQFKVLRAGDWADPAETEFEITDAGDGMWLYRFSPQDEAVLFMIVVGQDQSESNA